MGERGGRSGSGVDEIRRRGGERAREMKGARVIGQGRDGGAKRVLSKRDLAGETARRIDAHKITAKITTKAPKVPLKSAQMRDREQDDNAIRTHVQTDE